ncbi:MAG: hypothetical protein OJF49_002562 [Ktedonobacterales bacterium]|jgi:Cof subfamily protein (haloacid dehalogenase superfamily)|nr:MAG: hypothetical protein OJF49_002562 [Ktedonobacterales bacterium]
MVFSPDDADVSAAPHPLERARPRVIALDLDGTLLRSDKTISPRTLAAVSACAASGIRPVIASARPPRSVRALLPDSFPASTWICYNGAETWEHGRRAWHDALAAQHALVLIAALAALAPAAMIAIEVDNHIYANQTLTYPWLQESYDVVDLASAITSPISKILFDATAFADAVADPDALCASLPVACSLVVTDSGSLGHIMAHGVTKARGVGALVERWGLSLAHVAAFGDDSNDLELIAACGLGIAMGNASDTLKAAAAHVTLTNDEDGVAIALERLLANTSAL